MKSLTTYTIEEDGDMIDASMDYRDPRGSWALDMVQTGTDSFLISDFKKNLI